MHAPRMIRVEGAGRSVSLEHASRFERLTSSRETPTAAFAWRSGKWRTNFDPPRYGARYCRNTVSHALASSGAASAPLVVAIAGPAVRDLLRLRGVARGEQLAVATVLAVLLFVGLDDLDEDSRGQVADADDLAQHRHEPVDGFVAAAAVHGDPAVQMLAVGTDHRLGDGGVQFVDDRGLGVGGRVRTERCFALLAFTLGLRVEHPLEVVVVLLLLEGAGGTDAEALERMGEAIDA